MADENIPPPRGSGQPLPPLKPAGGGSGSGGSGDSAPQSPAGTTSQCTSNPTSAPTTNMQQPQSTAKLDGIISPISTVIPRIDSTFSDGSPVAQLSRTLSGSGSCVRAAPRRSVIGTKRVQQDDALSNDDEDDTSSTKLADSQTRRDHKLQRLEANVTLILRLLQAPLAGSVAQAAKAASSRAPRDDDDDDEKASTGVRDKFASSTGQRLAAQRDSGAGRNWSVASELWGGNKKKTSASDTRPHTSPKLRKKKRSLTTPRQPMRNLSRRSTDETEDVSEEDAADRDKCIGDTTSVGSGRGEQSERNEEDEAGEAADAESPALNRQESCKAYGGKTELGDSMLIPGNSASLKFSLDNEDDAGARIDDADDEEDDATDTPDERFGARDRRWSTPAAVKVMRAEPARLALPESRGVTLLEMVMLACCFGDALLATYHPTVQSWYESPPVGEVVFMALSSLVGWVFIALQHQVARLAGYRLIDESRAEVTAEYRKTWFWFDVAALGCPLDLVVLGGTVLGFRILQCFRVIKIIRIQTLFRSSNPLKSDRNLPLKACVWVFFMHHCVACLHMLVKERHSTFEDYVESLYWAVQTTTSVGYGDIGVDAHTVRVQLFATAFMIMGSGFYAWFLGNVSAYFMAQDYMQQQQNQTKSMVLSLMMRYEVPLQVQKEAYTIYPLIFGEDASSNFESVFHLFPPYLEAKLRLQVKLHLLRRVPMFRDAEIDILEEVAARLDRFVLDPNTEVIEIGEVGKEMFFISSGAVEVLIPTGPVMKRIALLTDGLWFGEIALLKDTRRTAAVRTVTMCDLFMLTKDDFFEIIECHPKSNFERGILAEVERRVAVLGSLPNQPLITTSSPPSTVAANSPTQQHAPPGLVPSPVASPSSPRAAEKSNNAVIQNRSVRFDDISAALADGGNASPMWDALDMQDDAQSSHSQCALTTSAVASRKTAAEGLERPMSFSCRRAQLLSAMRRGVLSGAHSAQPPPPAPTSGEGIELKPSPSPTHKSTGGVSPPRRGGGDDGESSPVNHAQAAPKAPSPMVVPTATKAARLGKLSRGRSVTHGPTQKPADVGDLASPCPPGEAALGTPLREQSMAGGSERLTSMNTSFNAGHPPLYANTRRGVAGMQRTNTGVSGRDGSEAPTVSPPQRLATFNSNHGTSAERRLAHVNRVSHSQLPVGNPLEPHGAPARSPQRTDIHGAIDAESAGYSERSTPRPTVIDRSEPTPTAQPLEHEL